VHNTKLTASDGAARDFFGSSVSLSEDRLVVGAHGDDLGFLYYELDSGAAYVYERNGSAWVEKAKLTASDAAPIDYFGFSVSLSEDWLVVGAHGDDGVGNKWNMGSAYVFRSSVNKPPVASAGDDQTVECQGALTPVTLDGSGSSDPDGDPLTYTWTVFSGGSSASASGVSPTVSLDCGTHTIILTVGDPHGATDSDKVVIDIEDTTPPAIALLGDDPLTLECCLSMYEEPGATVTDACDLEPALEIDASSVDPEMLDSYAVNYTATDVSGNSATATRTVNVVDTTPPEVAVNQPVTNLWPPNHKMHLVATVSATDACAKVGDRLSLDIEVTSNQDINGLGDGDTEADWEIADAGDGLYEVWLRAERSGKEGERVYTITATADDGPNETEVVSVVTVAHDQSDEEKRGKGKGKAKLVALPTSYELYQNAPNPFNLETQIAYQLPESGEVSLVVYNMLGQPIRTLVYGFQSAGYYQVSWDGTNAYGQVVPSGVYLYRFVSKGLVESKHMLVVK